MSSAEPRPGEAPRGRYSFRDFTLDLEAGFLHRAGEEIALRPKSFQVLAYLVEHHGRLISREELMNAIWPGVAVTDESLTKCIADIRKALDDDTQQLVRTVARRGYVFAAPVLTPILEFPPQPRLAAITSRKQPTHWWLLGLGAAFVLLAAARLATLAPWRIHTPRQNVAYEQITNFTDSAVSPALSPDGKMLAFLRSDTWFLFPDQIYVKMLPNGAPVQVTHDPSQKYGPIFTPDSSRIMYSAFPPWSTYTVSVLGGERQLFLANSSGVTWLDEHHILFSEVQPPNGIHMGVVTAREDRSEKRSVYFPREERAMVHLSYASPDRKWVLVLEMNPVWQPCRVVPLDGSSSGRQVGPKGHCTSAAWSRDGKWMYFGVDVDGSHHLWRQRFPRGEPEQITFGATEEDGIAVAPDGRSIITSVGLRQGVVSIHDGRGDRPLFSQGHVRSPDPVGEYSSAGPVFSRDGKSIFYLKSELAGSPQELWKTDPAQIRRFTPMLSRRFTGISSVSRYMISNPRRADMVR